MTFKTWHIYTCKFSPQNPNHTVTIWTYKLWRLCCRLRRTRTQICACLINASLYRHCSPSSDENFKVFWIFVRVLVLNKFRKHVKLMSSNLVLMSSIIRINMSVLLAVFDKLRVVRQYDLCSTCAWHATSFNDFSVCTNLVVFCSTFLWHRDGDWALLF